MAERELRKLKRRDLLQMLLVQCQETERLQQETDEMKERFDAMAESYERLKKKLDVKDERLNQKDAKISELRREIERMKVSRAAEIEEVGSITDATIRLNEVFEEAQRAAEMYLINVQRIKKRIQGKASPHVQEMPKAEPEGNSIPFQPNRISNRERAEAARMEQPVLMPSRAEQNQSREEVQTEESEPKQFAAASGGIYG